MTSKKFAGKRRTSDFVMDYIKKWERNKDSVERGKFWTFVADDFVYIAVDNSAGDCLVEEFSTASKCKDYLE
jgi:hypothetical protein